MAAITTVLAIASLVVAAGSAYVSYKPNQAAARNQKKANQVAQAEQSAQKQTEIRNQVQKERVKREQIIQASQNSRVVMSRTEERRVGKESVSTFRSRGDT